MGKSATVKGSTGVATAEETPAITIVEEAPVADLDASAAVAEAVAVVSEVEAPKRKLTLIERLELRKADAEAALAAALEKASNPTKGKPGVAAGTLQPRTQARIDELLANPEKFTITEAAEHFGAKQSNISVMVAKYNKAHPDAPIVMRKSNRGRTPLSLEDHAKAFIAHVTKIGYDPIVAAAVVTEIANA